LSTILAWPTYAGDLGGGLVRRWSTPADQGKIAHLLGMVHRDSPDEPLNLRAADVARVLMSEGFPFMGPGDWAVVEDRGRPDRPLVACTCLWRLQWRYGGIPFGVGQPEMVATAAHYRNRGLVRALFEMVHARSKAEGHLVQAITGIPYFYRQFGYEYVLDLEGSRLVYLAAIPGKAGDGPEPYRLRPATLDDIPRLMALYETRRSASLVWQDAPEAFWRHLIASWDDPLVRQQGAVHSALTGRLYMIVADDGQVGGYTWLAAKRWGRDLLVFALELGAHTNWQAAMPSLLRLLRRQGEQTPVVRPPGEPFEEIRLQLGRSHPLYDVLGERLAPRYEPPYAWYLRVEDAAAFVHHIAPVLEGRIARSVLAGYTGEVKIDFYRGGLRLQWAQGKLAAAEPWRTPAYGEEAGAGCPPLTFLQLLFGYRSLAELRATFPDVWANSEAALLLNILFPLQPSTVPSLGYI
jgi:hypothetical protein